MGSLGSVLRGVGQTGADVGTGAGILEQQRHQQLEEQLRRFQLGLELSQFQDKIKQQGIANYQKSPEGIVAQAEGVLKRPLTPEERQRLIGVQPPASAPFTPNEGVIKALATKWAQEGVKPPVKYQPEVEAYMAANNMKTSQPKKSGVANIDPIIAAQVGKPPDPSRFPQGENDPAYQAQMKLWGVEAEKIKDRMAAASGAARGAAYQLNRPAAYITPKGELVTATGGTAIREGYIPAAPGFQAMSKQAQFGEIQSASQKLRRAISNLQPGDAFTPQAVIQMGLAMNAPDAGSIHTIASNLMASGLNERQQDYAIWLTQMAERLLSIRNIAGMGQGAEDLRRAIQATLPNIASGNPEFALRRMDAVDNQISQLYRGIPKVSTIVPPSSQQSAPTDETDDAIIKALGGKPK